MNPSFRVHRRGRGAIAATLLGLAVAAAVTVSAGPAAFGQTTAAAKSAANKSKKPVPASVPKKGVPVRRPVTAWGGNTTREFSLVAKSYTEKQGPAGSILTLGGDVTIVSLETKLKADNAIFDRSAQIATTQGRMQFDDVQQTLTGDTGSANYRTQEADLKGSVLINVRSLPEAGAARPLGTLAGDTCAYNWRDRVATITGNVALKLRDRTVTADRAVYDGRAQTVSLTGNVLVVNDQGDRITGSKAVLMLKQGAEQTSMQDGASSVLKVRDGEAPSATPPAASGATPIGQAPADGGDTSPAGGANQAGI